MGQGHTLDANTLGLWRFDEGLVDTRGTTFTDSNGLAWSANEALPSVTAYDQISGTAYARRFISVGPADSGKKSSLTRASSAGIRSMLIASWTVEMFIRFDVNIGTTNWVTTHTGDQASETSANNTLQGIAMLTGGALFTIWENGAGVNTALTWTFAPTLGTWYHIAFTKNTATKEVKLYVDGVLSQTQGYANEPTDGTSGTWCIGTGDSRTTASQGFDGRIRSIMWSSVVRDQTYMTATAALKTTTGIIPTDGSTHTRLNFDSAPAAIDISPNAFHLVSAGAGATNVTGPSASLIRNDVLGGLARSFNQCLLFTGYSTLIRNTILADFTVEAFVQLMAPTPATSSIVFTFGGDTFSEVEVANVAEGGIAPDGSVFFLIERGAGINETVQTAPGLVTIGQIYHFAVRKTMTGATWTGAIFLDGVKVAEATGLTNYSGGTDIEASLFSVGGGTQAVFFGYLDDVRFSDIARTDTEIAQGFEDGGVETPTGSIVSVAPSELSRWTPVVYVVELPLGTMFIVYEAGTNRTVIYDGSKSADERWLPSFADRSTVVTNADSSLTVTILPNGGWHNSNFDMKFLSGMEMV